MSGWVLFIKLLLVRYATQSPIETHANCHEDVQLKCAGVDAASTKFLSVTWYKLNGTNKPQGIIRRGKNDQPNKYQTFKRPAEFGEKYSLLLRNVIHEDSGSYQCSISANVGSQNQDFTVDLIVNVCVIQGDLTTVTNTLNTTCSNPLSQDLPIMWSIIGYVAVGLAKVFLSLFSIWVIRALRKRSSRKRQHQW